MIYAKYEINPLEKVFTPLEYTFILLFAFGSDLHNKELGVMNYLSIMHGMNNIKIIMFLLQP